MTEEILTNRGKILILVGLLLEICGGYQRWLSQSECTYGNFYYNSTTSQCEEWPYGTFYASSLRECINCDSSCYDQWAYMSNCFDWSADQYLDLDTMTCVDQCDLDTSIPIDDAQFDNRPFCRGFNYFVDPDSESVIELGTKLYPYKDIGYAFVELLNYHSHSDRNITVNVKEYTRNYLILGMNYVMNTTFVKISPYSSVSDAVPGKAILVGIEDGELVEKIGTSFNIMKSFEIRISTTILNKTTITETEKGYISTDGYVVAIFRSNFMIDNMEFETEYSSLLYKQSFLFFVWIQEKLITMTNQHWRTSGEIMGSNDPLNMYMENIDVDYHKNIGGMVFWTQ